MSQIQIQMIDNSVSSDWWRNLVSHFVRAGDELEIRCWKEETAEIEQASLYGELAEDKSEVSICGTVTDIFLSELLLEEPTDKDIYNKMTKYFTINIKNENCDFCSAHYGTELYIERVNEDDITFVSELINRYCDCFSIYVAV